MSKTDVLLTNRHFAELNPIIMGAERCNGGHRFGPAVRGYTLLHYVVSGRGVFCNEQGRYPVKAGEVFRILPGEVTVYQADEEDPWNYRWIGFDGSLATRFAELPPVFALPPEAAASFSLEDADDGVAEYRIAAKLFRLYAELFSMGGKKSNYVRRVQDYIAASYMTRLRVEEIAAYMHLDRRYLSRIFREKLGQSIQEYILSVRMEEAAKLLTQGLRVGEVAERCGYSDAFLFSKLFKKQFGISPMHWKKQQTEEKNRQ